MKQAATAIGLLLACALVAGCTELEGSEQPAGSGKWIGEGQPTAMESDRRYCRGLLARTDVREAAEARDSARRHAARSSGRAYRACMEARGWQVQ